MVFLSTTASLPFPIFDIAVAIRKIDLAELQAKVWTDGGAANFGKAGENGMQIEQPLEFTNAAVRPFVQH